MFCHNFGYKAVFGYLIGLSTADTRQGTIKITLEVTVTMTNYIQNAASFPCGVNIQVGSNLCFTVYCFFFTVIKFPQFFKIMKTTVAEHRWRRPRCRSSLSFVKIILPGIQYFHRQPFGKNYPGALSYSSRQCNSLTHRPLGVWNGILDK